MVAPVIRKMQTLKADSGFTPCPVADGDELYSCGSFEFNITRMLDHLETNSTDARLVEISVSGYSKGFSRINESHLGSINLSRPVILAEISPDNYNLIDGNHRVLKAHRLGIETICAYKLTVHQHIAFLISKRAYFTYVEYWNRKVKELKQARQSP